MGTEEWLNQINRRAGIRDTVGHELTIGSKEWMQAVRVKLGVYDKQGHGPTPDTDEWRNAIHWKAFGLQDVFKFFQQHDVRYVVIGGIASILHGVPRSTVDLDLEDVRLLELPEDEDAEQSAGYRR